MSDTTIPAAAYRKLAGLSEPGADRDTPATSRAQSEDELHRAVVDWLRSLEWGDPAPLWTHPASEESNKMKRIRDWRMGQEPGWGDFIFALPKGLTLFIEMKTETGRQSTDQREFEKRAKALGHPYVIARSINEVHEALRAAGVKYREPVLARAMREGR